jgi:hypothetical protein
VPFSRLDRFTHRWGDQSLVVGLTLKVSGRGRFRPMDAVEYRQPQEHNAIADAIERSAKEPTNYFERPVLGFADLGGCGLSREHPLSWLRTPRDPSRSSCSDFISAMIPI